MRGIDRVKEPALNITLINPMDTHGRGLFIWNAESTCILWGRGPGEETPGGLIAEEKWEKLRDWIHAKANRSVPEFHFWEITAGGMVHREGIAAPKRGQVARPVKDAATIRTKATGQSPQKLSH